MMKDERNRLGSVGTAPVICCLLAVLSAAAMAEDWPTFRHDNARSAVTEEALAPPLHPQWVFTPPHPPEPAWPDPAKEKARVRFDEVYHVAATGGAVYFGSSSDHKVYCLEAATGRLRWSAFTGGPVRVAPTVVGNRVYVGSDDGYAYCLQAADGAEVWKVKPSFRDDKVLGNGKMISLWPVRTGVMVENAIAYFGAGVFPHETVFLCAVKAETGEVLWRNDTYGQIGYKLEFGGISPQGPLLASANTLFVPSGRAMPGAFRKADGTFLNFLSPGGKVGGTWALVTEERLVAGVEAKRAYDAEKGAPQREAAYAWFPGVDLVVKKDHAYMVTFQELAALDRRAFRQAEEWRSQVMAEHKVLTDTSKTLKWRLDRAKGDARKPLEQEMAHINRQLADLTAQRQRIEDAVRRWRRPCSEHDALILAGDCLYLGGDGVVAAADAAMGGELWRAPVEGRACGLAAADGRLVVSTTTGQIHCFAQEDKGAQALVKAEAPSPHWPGKKKSSLLARAATEILDETGVTKGYCLVYGGGTGQLAYELATRSELDIVGIEPDPMKVQTARENLDAAGLQGTRVIIDRGDLSKLPYANHFANLVVSETMLVSGELAGSPAEILRVVKPWGGVVCLGRPAGAEKALDAAALRAWLGNIEAFEIQPDTGGWLLARRGAMPDSGAWTHQYADSGNTACSMDERVRGPLGVLWFGRPGPEQMVERHARAAAPVAMDGRMFVQGENVVMAYDAYNGVLLWERQIPGAVRVRVDSDMSNLALTRDGLYVAVEDQCLCLDPATGQTLRTLHMPERRDGASRRWGYLACAGGALFGSTAKPLHENYGIVWEEIVDENGQWRDFDEAVEKRKDKIPDEYRNAVAKFRQRFPEASEQAYWDAQQTGFMWHTMSPFPAWGSVETPVGAVTERIMASDTFFALDAASGSLRWEYEGKAVAHPAIAIDGGVVFLADCNVTEEEKQAAMKEREALIAQGVWEGDKLHYGPNDADVRLVLALDAQTGQEKWRRIMDLTGCGGDRMGLACKDGVLCFFGCFSNHDRNLFKAGRLAWRRVTAVSCEDGHDLWSRPLNYLRRPVIVGGEIIIEPRICNLHTGAIKTRAHPLTGAESTWEFVRPGHCCSITSASANMFFLRGYFLWYYDLERDQGMLPFGGIRPGCWINTIPANGLLLFPEASSGCTCSYPIRSTVVLEPKEEFHTWATCVQNGGLTPVKHMAINLGAPGDWRDKEGVMWFGYPHPPSTSWHDYGVNFDIKPEFVEEPAYFCRDFQGLAMQNTDKPWLFASGCEGLKRCVVPLLSEGQEPATYTVRLYFMETGNIASGQRVFSIRLQDTTVLPDFDIVQEAGGTNAAVVKEFTGIHVEDGLRIEFVPAADAAESSAPPRINGIEVVREE